MLKHQEVQVNLKKAQSHLAKIINMVEDDQYCIDIMQQNLAVIGLLKSVHQMLIESHLNHCFQDAMETSDHQKQQQMTTEILHVTRLAGR